MLHLLAYDELIKLGPNILVDADDYVHFLIALEAHESLLDDVALFRKLLTEHLVAYIYELMAEDRKEYIYYMLHIPKCNQVVEISSILSSNKLLASTDWLFFKRHMETTQLELLMRETLQKHVKQHHDYLVAAEKMLELLGD